MRPRATKQNRRGRSRRNAHDLESGGFEERSQRGVRLVRDDEHSFLIGRVPIGGYLFLDCLHNNDTSQGRSRFDEVTRRFSLRCRKSVTKLWRIMMLRPNEASSLLRLTESIRMGHPSQPTS